ncbi:MAG: acetylxylan esterase [Parabacteroides distasonis]|nr:acetylxylan esterase [Parabacteroides distasonis]MBQ4161659.1 acetylxylan esterase [Parabacteroides sp.]
MKKILFSLCVLFAFISNNISMVAQPAQKMVNVVITPNCEDWQCSVKEEVTFAIHVLKNKVLLKNVTVDYEIGPEFFPTETKENVLLKEGKLTLKASMKEPGFLRCKVRAKVDGKTYEELATIGVDVDKIKPTVSEPKDFDSFWNEAIESARKLPLDPIITLVPEQCTSTKNVYHVNFQNDGSGSRVYGWLMVPKKPGKYPAVLQVPGAGVYAHTPFSELGGDIITLMIGIHGIPFDMQKNVYNQLYNGALRSYHRINMNNKNTHYYKRVYVGCVRAIDFIYTLPEFDGKTLGVTGRSQGGALSIVTAALDSRVKFLAALYPALCDHTGYLHNRASGWPHYFRLKKPVEGEVETLSYFDVVNFARRVKVQGYYSWGYNDMTCPPTSMYSAYNVIPGEKELHLYLDTHHWFYPEQMGKLRAWLRMMCGERK